VTGGRSKAQAGPSEQTRQQSRGAKGRQGGGRRVSRVGEGGRRRRAEGGSGAVRPSGRRAGGRRDRQGRSRAGREVRRDRVGAGTGLRIRLLGYFFDLGYNFFLKKSRLYR